MPTAVDTTPRLDGGLPTSREREGFYQFKLGGAFYRLRSFLFGPSGDADQAKFNEHKFDGRNRPDSYVMTSLDSLWSGAFSPYYSELPVIHRNLYGAPVSSDLINTSNVVDSAGTRRREVFYLSPTGGNVRQTWSAQFGQILYGRWKIRSFSADVTRNGDGGAFSGNITAHANDILNYAAPIPGMVAQNAKFSIVATGVSGNLITGYKLPTSSTVRQVTHVPGDTALQTKAKYEAFGDGVTVNVVGTITTTSTNEVQTVNAPGVSSILFDAQSGGSAQTINAADTASSKQAKLALIYNKTNGDIVVTDSSVAPSSGLPTSFTAASSGGSVAHAGNYTQQGTVNGAPWYWTGSSANTFYWSGTNWVTAHITPTNGSSNTSADEIGGTNINSPLTGWSNYTFSNVVGGVASAGNTVFTATFSGTSVAGTNIAQLTTSTSGVTIATTTQGGTVANGTQTIEFTAPANSAVTLSKVSGDAGYVLTTTQAGSDGSGAPLLPDSPPVESKNVLIYMASSWAELNSIGLDDDNASQILEYVVGHTFSSGDNANAVWTENRKVAPSNWVSLANEVSFSLVMIKNPFSLSEVFRVLQDGCTVGKQYFRIAYRCDNWQWLTDGKYSRNEPQAKGNENELPIRTTPFMLMDDTISSLRTTIIGPVADYFTGE